MLCNKRHIVCAGLPLLSAVALSVMQSLSILLMVGIDIPNTSPNWVVNRLARVLTITGVRMLVMRALSSGSLLDFPMLP